MKTIDDYLNDPRLHEEPEMDAPIKKIHAARLMLQDETAGMAPEEKAAYINARGREALARRGLASRIVDLSGQGRVTPRAPVTV